MFYFHHNFWWGFPFWLTFFRWVGSTTNHQPTPCQVRVFSHGSTRVDSQNHRWILSRGVWREQPTWLVPIGSMYIMYGIFTYMKTINLSHSCRFSYTYRSSHGSGPMGFFMKPWTFGRFIALMEWTSAFQEVLGLDVWDVSWLWSWRFQGREGWWVFVADFFVKKRCIYDLYIIYAALKIRTIID